MDKFNWFNKLYFRLLLIMLVSNPFLLSQDSLVFVIRVDDIMNRNTSISPRSIKPFEKVVEQRDAKVSWGVIPHRLIESVKGTDSLIQELIETDQKGHEICLHGYNHICPHCGGYHEFYCPQNPLSYNEQDSLINAGTPILKSKLGITATSFIPPSHAADSTTYQVLLDNGINIISLGDPGKNYLYENLYNMGINGEYTWNLEESSYHSQLNNALDDIHDAAQENHYFGILFHDHFIRTGYRDSLVLEWTGELLDSVIAKYGDRIEFKTVSEAATYFQNQNVAIKTEEHLAADEFSLAQNYPNPFNSTTTINYTLPKSADVNISIYSLEGEHMETLINRNKSAGYHTIRWDAENLPSGVYLYRIRTGKFDKVKKCMLLK